MLSLPLRIVVVLLAATAVLAEADPAATPSTSPPAPAADELELSVAMMAKIGFCNSPSSTVR